MTVDWNKIKDAALPQERAGYFTEGHFKVEIGKCHSFTTRAGIDMFAVEATVLESNNAEHPQGVTRAWLQKMNLDVSFSAIKGFLLPVAFGLSEDSDKAAIAAAEEKMPRVMLALEKNPQLLAGKTADLDCRQILTKRNEPFTLHVWKPWTRPEGWQPKDTPGAAPKAEDPAKAAQEEQKAAGSVVSASLEDLGI